MRTEEQTRAFLAERREVLGASDAPVVLGLTPPGWRQTPLTVWAKKTGLQGDGDETETPGYIEWGHRLEGVILRKWADDHGADLLEIEAQLATRHGIEGLIDANGNRARKLVIRISNPATGEAPLIRHPDRPWMGAHPDAFAWSPDQGLGLIQAKTTNAFQRSAWADGPPIYYRAQVQHELAVAEPLGVTWANLAVLIGGNDYRADSEQPNERFRQALVRRLAMFWDGVKTKTRPEATGTAADAAILALLYPEEDASTCQLPDEAAELTERVWTVKSQIRELEAEEQRIRTRIMELMESHSCGILPGNMGNWFWKSQSRKGYTKVVEPWTGRVLRGPRQPKRG